MGGLSAGLISVLLPNGAMITSHPCPSSSSGNCFSRRSRPRPPIEDSFKGERKTSGDENEKLLNDFDSVCKLY